MRYNKRIRESTIVCTANPQIQLFLTTSLIEIYGYIGKDEIGTDRNEERDKVIIRNIVGKLISICVPKAEILFRLCLIEWDARKIVHTLLVVNNYLT